MPSTILCISCATAHDVPRLRRFDDHAGEMESQTLFTHNPYLETAICSESSRAYNSIVDDEEPITHRRILTIEDESVDDFWSFDNEFLITEASPEKETSHALVG
jgi:hypothetical protein